MLLFFFLLITFIHSLCQAALAIMAVPSVSFHQASPSALQQPFFLPSVQSAIAYSLSPSHSTSPSVCQIFFFQTTFLTFLFINPGPGKCCSIKPNATGEGCLLICLPYTWMKEQQCFCCTVHTKQTRLFRLCLLFRKPRLHKDYNINIFWFSYVKKYTCLWQVFF